MSYLRRYSPLAQHVRPTASHGDFGPHEWKKRAVRTLVQSQHAFRQRYQLFVLIDAGLYLSAAGRSISLALISLLKISPVKKQLVYLILIRKPQKRKPAVSVRERVTLRRCQNGVEGRQLRMPPQGGYQQHVPTPGPRPT